MALPELLTNSATPGTRVAYTTLEAVLKTGETSMKWVLAPPTSCRGTGAAGVGGQFRVVIGSEIILCEAGESKTIVILKRAEEGSAEAEHVNESNVWIVPTAEGIKLTSGSLVEVITSTKTWTKPKGAATCAVTVIGGGGGGGAGSQTAASTACAGGGGGSGAASNFYVFPAENLAATITATVGKGGAGGVKRETEGAGEAGKNGEPSHFGELLFANGGELGKGGTTEVGGAAGGAIKGQFPSNAGAAGGGKVEGASAAAPTGGGAGGGGGGGGSTATEAKKGGTGGFSYLGSEAKAAGGAAGAEGSLGAEGSSGTGLPGHGGGGGGSGFNASAGKGGAGGKYGGGGGGGGGNSTVGKATGAGGAGGEGVIIVVTEF